MTNLYKMGVRESDYERNVKQGLFARKIVEKLGLMLCALLAKQYRILNRKKVPRKNIKIRINYCVKQINRNKAHLNSSKCI